MKRRQERDTSGSLATASRRASVRCAESSVSSRSDRGRTPSVLVGVLDAGTVGGARLMPGSREGVCVHGIAGIGVASRRGRPRQAGLTGGSSSGRTKPRSTSRVPSLSMLTKAPALPICSGSKAIGRLSNAPRRRSISPAADQPLRADHQPPHVPLPAGRIRHAAPRG